MDVDSRGDCRMRVVIDNPVRLYFVSDEDVQTLEKCTVFYTIEANALIISPQKITLDSDHMEEILSIIDLYGTKVISLQRYSHGRYGLKLTTEF